jgi:hypothetical protein
VRRRTTPKMMTNLMRKMKKIKMKRAIKSSKRKRSVQKIVGLRYLV